MKNEPAQTTDRPAVLGLARSHRSGCSAALALPLLLIFLAFIFLKSLKSEPLLLDVRPRKEAGSIEALKRELARLARKNKKLHGALARAGPRGVYIVIDTAHNRLYLRKGVEMLVEAPCSTGSGRMLEDPAHGRIWLFDTPRGEFKVLAKFENPVWRRPDWAFIEEGEAVPRDEKARLEAGVLGDYALAFASGYFIHGTLYSRLLGKSVTHGCVRLGADALERVFKASKIGTPVFIF